MKDFFRHNGILILIIAVLLALITAVFSVLFSGFANPLANVLGVVTTPVRNGLNAFANWTEGVYSDVYNRDALTQEVARLQEELAGMEKKAREGEAASRENQRLRNLLGLREKRQDLVLESATVTAHSTSNWSSTLTISKGSSLGVTSGNCVVDEYGNLVGIVGEVGLNWATITTVIDTDIELGGLLARTDGAAILQGDFALMGQGKLKLAYLPENSALMAGDQVLTSGLGGVYPPGLVVGHIEEVHTEASGMAQYAVVVPEADLAGVKQVFVIQAFDVVE